MFCLDKRSNGSNEVRRGLGVGPFRFTGDFQLIELLGQFLFVERDLNSALHSKTLCCRDLMIVSVFT